MRTKLFTLLAAFPIALATSCGSSTPVDFAGTYTVTVVEGANTCNDPNWKANNSDAGIPVTFTQDGATAQLEIMGVIGGLLSLGLGTNKFMGTVSDNTFSATYLGTNNQTSGSCSYKTNVKLSVTLDNNSVVSGTITYTYVTNNDPSCGALTGCAGNIETVSGSRTGM